MDDLDKELKGAFAQNGNFDHERAEREKRRACAGFHKRLAKVERWTWIWHIILAVGLVLFLSEMKSSGDIPTLIRSGVFASILAAGLVVIKLWYWVLNAKLGIQQDIQRLRFDLVDSKVLPPETLNEETLRSGPGKEFPRSRERIFWWIVLIIIIVTCFVGIRPDSRVVIWVSGIFGNRDYIVTEVDQWHIQPDNTIEAHSLLTLTKWTDEDKPMLLKFPYKDALMESATLGESEIPWSVDGEGEAKLDLTGVSYKGSKEPIRIVWTLPLTSLESAGTGFRTNLRSLAPATEFSLTVVLEEGCGYQIKDAYKSHPDQREITCFSEERASPAHTSRGSCSLGIWKNAPGE